MAVVMVALDVATWDVASRLRHCNPGECDCRERRDEFDLVHCRVPFILCASPFSRLHRVRTIRREFLTKDLDIHQQQFKIRTGKRIISCWRNHQLKVLHRGGLS